MRLFCFGFGYAAEALARRLSARTTALAGTRTRIHESPPLGARLATFQSDRGAGEVRSLLSGTTHLLVSIPPDLEGDVVLRHFRDDLLALCDLDWVGYLSTVGVYGDCQGRWVDETSPARPANERSLRRLQAEQAWRDFGRDSGRRVEVFRLAGIYGPGRSLSDSLRAGTARRIVKPGQVFNRIHVADLAQTIDKAMDAALTRRAGGIFNAADDEPSAPGDPVLYAATLLGVAPPVEIAFEEAKRTMSPLAVSFYGENKRVRNDRIKSVLGVSLRYPTYREGLRALATKRSGAPGQN